MSKQPTAPRFTIDQGLEYYAGKSELLDWVNRLLDLNLVRLEQLTSGAVYCQIIDAFYADAVAIHKVNFVATEEYEILYNYKVLQAAFIALGFTKEFDIPKLSTASTSDLMEFAQWLYKSFKGVAVLPGYNPSARRKLSKGPTNSIPFPACIMNGNFDFTRSDLRMSGVWGASTPLEPVKSVSRTQRPASSTPSTSGKAGTAEKGGGGSSVKRSKPNLNVPSRYREGLAVPPEHYTRSSPQLSPGSGLKLPQVPTRDGSAQTDFPDEEYRPMTSEDVGTETAPARVSMRDAGEQYEVGFGYGSGPGGGSNGRGGVADEPGPSRSASGPPPGLNGSHSQPGDAFTFGQVSPTASVTSAPDPPAGAGADVTPLVHARASTGSGSGSAEGSGWGDGEGQGAAAGGVDAEGLRESTPSQDGEADRGPGGEEEGAAAGSSGQAAGSGSAAMATQAAADAGVGTADDDAAPAESGFAGFATPATSPGRSGDSAAGPLGDLSLATAFGARQAIAATAVRSPTGSIAGLGQGPPSPSPGVHSPGAGSAGPSTPAMLRRSGAGGLPPDIASLLASPGIRHPRVATAGSQRNMAAALDVSAAALAAVHKGLDSYGKLLDGFGGDAAADGATAPSAADGAEGGGGAADCSAALCGKARSLQDALQTVLAHTSLLLADVVAYCEVTQSAPSAASPRLTSPRLPSPARTGGGTGAVEAGASAASPTVAPVAAANGKLTEAGGGEDGQRNYLAEALALQELARSHEGRLQSLMEQAGRTLQLPAGDSLDRGPAAASAASTSATTAAASSPAAAAAAAAVASLGAAAAAGAAASSSHQHLTSEQRKLCSTSALDAHLKAVGAVQFALVQGIHKELVELTTAHFRHAGSGEASGGDGGGGGVSRKARAFKLGEYQLKQLRNGDVYKGRYISNKKNGEGVYHFINADVYEGEFRDDRMDGHGVYTFSHEGRYEGQWRNAVYNGTGAETFAKGSTYRGEYAAGLRSGWGVCRFYNGDYYEGQWVKGQRDGSGMQQCTDDSNFVGDYQRGKRHGHGVYSFPNGDRYEGQYHEDLPHGHGTYHFASGQCYQGQWLQGKKHGWSVYTVDNGSRFMGLWSQGKPTWVQALSADGSPTTAPGSGSAEGAGEDSGRSLQQALEARDHAVQAAATARQRAAGHWDVCGAVQGHVQSALGRANAAAAAAQAARRKACHLAAKLDEAVALLQTQGGGPGPTTPPAALASPPAALALPAPAP